MQCVIMSLNRFSVPRVMISRGTLFCGLLFPLSSLQIFFFFFFLFSLVASRATVVLGRNRIRAARQCLHVKLYMQKMDCVRYQNVGENKHSGICLLYVGGGRYIFYVSPPKISGNLSARRRRFTDFFSLLMFLGPNTIDAPNFIAWLVYPHGIQ